MKGNHSLGIIAGSGGYPLLLARAARQKGVDSIFAAAFQQETDPALAELCTEIEWMRVGQLAKLVRSLSTRGISRAMMAGQIAPKNLFDLRPDFRALVVLSRLKHRNAESIFGAIAREMADAGVELLDARTYLENELATPGHIAGPKLKRRRTEDVEFGFEIAKATSRLDIGQTVIVKNGTVLAVEAFEGTNEAIRRGGALGRGNAIMVKVSKPGQDFRFDVPVIGETTLQVAAASGVSVVAVEAATTLLLDRERIASVAEELKVSIVGVKEAVSRPASPVPS